MVLDRTIHKQPMLLATHCHAGRLCFLHIIEALQNSDTDGLISTPARVNRRHYPGISAKDLQASWSALFYLLRTEGILGRAEKGVCSKDHCIHNITPRNIRSKKKHVL
jgi:hypothetical protein